MTNVGTGRSTSRRQNRHDQAVLSGEVRRLVGVLRAGGPRRRASQSGSPTPSAGGGGPSSGRWRKRAEPGQYESFGTTCSSRVVAVAGRPETPNRTRPKASWPVRSLPDIPLVREESIK